MRGNGGELFIAALAFCLVIVLGLPLSVTPTSAEGASRGRQL